MNQVSVSIHSHAVICRIIIEQLVREENLSVILSTAYMDEAERCHQVYVMLDGQVLKQGTPD